MKERVFFMVNLGSRTWNPEEKEGGRLELRTQEERKHSPQEEQELIWETVMRSPGSRIRNQELETHGRKEHKAGRTLINSQTRRYATPTTKLV